MKTHNNASNTVIEHQSNQSKESTGLDLYNSVLSLPLYVG